MAWSINCAYCTKAKQYGTSYSCDKEVCDFEPFKTYATTRTEMLSQVALTNYDYDKDKETKRFNHCVENGIEIPPKNPYELVGALGTDGSFKSYTKKTKPE